MARRDDVPIRVILKTLGFVLAILATLWFVEKTSRVLTWILLAAFFAIVLNPLVDWIVKHVRLRRPLAVTLVVLAVLGTLTVLGFVFVRPLAKEGTAFATEFPTYVEDATQGKGQIGKYIKEHKLDKWVEKNLPEIQKKITEVFQPSDVVGTVSGAIGSVFNIVAAVLTIVVLTILMLLQGQGLLDTALTIVPEARRERVKRVCRDSAKAITGYVAGNLLISVIAAATTWIVLVIMRVPYAGVLALWVGFADIIPLVGATLGAIPTVIVAFLHSTTAGVVVVIFYVIYQQFENHVLQVTIMSRTVALKPLIVLISVLIGVDLFGFLGALLSIPVAGVIKVVGLDVLEHRGASRALAEPPMEISAAT